MKQKGNPFKRVLLKLSGEALQGASESGIDPEIITSIAEQIKQVKINCNTELAIVIGGGNIFRGCNASELGIDRVSGDYMGMLATVINALALQASIEKTGIETRVMTSIPMQQIGEPYIRRKAVRHLEKGRIVIFGAGTGNPFFTTDTCAALRASEINAEIMLKATKVDGIYCSDPVKNKDAIKYRILTYDHVIKNNLKALDTAAVSLCRDNLIPIMLFDIRTEGNISKAIHGEELGTMVKHNE